MPHISPDDALRLVLENSSCLPSVTSSLHDAIGCVLAESIHADRDFPPFNRAMMDGYAVHSIDAGKSIPLIGEAAAGKPLTAPLAPGKSAEIMTGAPVPAGADAVVPHEDSKREVDRVHLPPTINPGQNIARQGSDCLVGTQVLGPGDLLTPLALAVLASVGRTEVSVYRRPSIAILTTGDELIQPGTAPGAAQIRDSNGPMLDAMARQLGITDLFRSHVADNEDALRKALDEHAARDMVILSGGVSMGKYDLVPGILAELGAKQIFHKVSQRPGKPLLFATRGSQLFFGLPGNPLSSFVCFHRYIRPAVKKMMHLPGLDAPQTGRLTEPLANNSPRTVFQLARAEWNAATNEWRLIPLRGASSADLFSAHAANAIIRLDSRQSWSENRLIEYDDIS